MVTAAPALVDLPTLAAPAATEPARPRMALRRFTIALIVTLLVALTGGGGLASPPPAHANPLCTAAGIAIPGAGAACNAVTGAAGHAAGNAIKDAASGTFKGVVQSLLDGMGKMLEVSFTWFVKIPTPVPAAQTAISKFQQLTLQIQLAGLVVSLIVGGIRLAVAKRQAAFGAAEELFTSMYRAVFGAWMFGGIMIALTAASDAIANELLLEVSNNDPGKMFANLVGTSALMSGFGSGLMFVISIVGILGGLLQAVLLLARQSMLVVLVSMMPVIGAASGTGIGKMAFSRAMNWCMSMLLWKPVAACVFGVAFMMEANAGKDPNQQLTGLILVSLSAFVLPVLMRLVSGGMAMSGGSGIAAATMAMGAAAGVASLGATAAKGAAAPTGGAQSTAALSGASGGMFGGGGNGGSSAGMAMSGGPSGGGPSGRGGGGGGRPSDGGGTGTGAGPSAARGGGGPSGSAAAMAGAGGSPGLDLSETAGAGQQSGGPSGGPSGGDGGGGHRGDVGSAAPGPSNGSAAGQPQPGQQSGGTDWGSAMNNMSSVMAMSAAAESFFADDGPPMTGDMR